MNVFLSLLYHNLAMKYQDKEILSQFGQRPDEVCRVDGVIEALRVGRMWFVVYTPDCIAWAVEDVPRLGDATVRLGDGRVLVIVAHP